MRSETRSSRQSAGGAKEALTEYVTALEEIYPAARGGVRVITRRDKRVIVSILLPARASDRMKLFDHMAEIGTKLLLKTGQYIILSGR